MHRLRQTLPLTPTWLFVLAFFAALLTTGLLTYKDYGVSWDEPTQLELGIKNYRYVMKHDPALLSFTDRYYGPLFENLLIIFQSQGPSQEMYFSRHLLNFLCFFFGCLGFFGLVRYIYKKTWLALVGSLFLVISPRLYADAFYNSKDIPFMVFYIFSLFSLIIFLNHPRISTAILHGIVSAALLAIRLPGMVIPALTLGALLLEVITGRLRWRSLMRLAPVYLIVTLVLLVLAWPALWPDPPRELLQAFLMMKNFPHITGMLYRGYTLPSTSVPWHYIPWWVTITTPPLYLGLCLVGLSFILIRWLRQPRCIIEPQGRSELIILGSLAGPLLAVILLRSTLYDAWRQMFFIYPPLLIVALRGIDGLHAAVSRYLSWKWVIPGLACLLMIGTAPTLLWMVRNHPYENVYFNRLAGSNLRTIRSSYEVDYWGLSYREGLAYLLEHDTAAKIPVYSESEPGERNAAIFPTDQEKRLEFVDTLAQAKYYVGNYYYEKKYPFKNEIFAVRVDNIQILSVFLLSEEEKR